VKAKLLDTANTMGQKSVRMMAGVLGLKTPISVRVLIEAAASDPFRTGTRITRMAGRLPRTALYFKPTKPSSGQAPLVIALHGHNDNGADFAAKTSLPALWPHATLIYPDGLLHAKGEDDDKSGWQKNIGDVIDDVRDRDLLLFDELLTFVASDQKVSRLKKVYVAGFSNGARMAYLLWSARPKSISAVAICAGGSTKDLSPKPAVLIHGKNDTRMESDGAERSIKRVLAANKARDDSFTGWPRGTKPKRKSRPPRPGVGGAETLVITHDGGHSWPAWSSPDVVKFFLEH
jgi:polyhydroxybutyrate depolymerase